MSQTSAGQPEIPFVQVLGIAQDGGYPQAGCQQPCCAAGWGDLERRRAVAALGIVDPTSGESWLIDATPDFPSQLAALQQAGGATLAGICLTHAHIGHYTGLIYLGKEAMATRQLPVYAMPRMQEFLREQQPWAVLCEEQRLQLENLSDQNPQSLNQRLQVTPVVVPHRAEFSETVGLVISGPTRRVLWLPDIDRWDAGPASLEQLLGQVDVAYVDGTFFDEDELVGRSLQDVPHPTVLETLEQLASLPASERDKVRFVHLNHTNPLLDPASTATAMVEQAGCQVARQGEQEVL